MVSIATIILLIILVALRLALSEYKNYTAKLVKEITETFEDGPHLGSDEAGILDPHPFEVMFTMITSPFRNQQPQSWKHTSNK